MKIKSGIREMRILRFDATLCDFCGTEPAEFTVVWRERNADCKRHLCAEHVGDFVKDHLDTGGTV